MNRRLGDFALPPSRVILLFFFFHAFDSSLLLVSSRALLFYHFLFDQLVGDINVLVTSHDSPGHTHPVVHYCTAFRTLLQYLTKFDSAAPIEDRLFMTGEINLCARAFVCVCISSIGSSLPFSLVRVEDRFDFASSPPSAYHTAWPMSQRLPDGADKDRILERKGERSFVSQSSACIAQRP